jgi:hypothetical protein
MYEFVVFSVFLDIFFNSGGWPLYFIASFVIVTFVEISKPYISLYTNE